MAEFVDPLIGIFSVLLLLVLMRWAWLSSARRKLSRSISAPELERFDPDIHDDEDDKEYSARVIERLRARVVEGRVEIHWKYRAEYVRKGFFLTGKSRQSGGDWRPLEIEPYEDSGSWIEDFNYGESRSYLFTVKKKYWFFFGLFNEEPMEVVCDQISFAVRKGRYLKEKKELIRDRTDLVRAATDYGIAVKEARRAGRLMNAPDEPPAIAETKLERLERVRKSRAEMVDYIEKQTAAINSNPAWSPERKEQEIERLTQMLEEMELEG
jgi:hypothetical protein